MTSLDPHRVGNTADQVYLFLIYDRLTQLGSDMTIKPMLAKSWTFSDDGKSLTLMLRDDVLFHDGSRLDAAAVKANLERALTLDRSTVATLLSSVQSVDVAGDFEVKLNLKPGEGGNLPAVLATSAGAMISPKAIADGRDLVLDPGDAGSGPYTPSVARPNDTVIFVHPKVKYWDTGAGLLKQLEVRFVQQAAARLNGIRAGQFDVAQIVGNDISAAKKMSASGAFDAYIAQSANVQSLLIRADRPALANVKLRQAIAHGIDRDAIAQAALGGNCLTTDQPVLKTNWAYNPDLAGFSNYDPDKAAALVKESGVASPGFDIVFAPGTYWEPQANIIQSMLGKVGIQVKLVAMQQSDALAAFRNGQVDAYQFTIPATIDPSLLINQLYLSGSNVTPKDRRDAVQAQATRGTDPSLAGDARAAVYQDVFRMGAEDVWAFPICAINMVWAHKKNIAGIDATAWHFAGLPDLRHLSVQK
jgi:peptide/nickel transport system substrate-binding protein